MSERKKRASTKSRRTKTKPRSESPKSRGRPPLDIDPETVEGMASFGASIEDVADFLEVSRDTVERHFAAIFHKHKAGKRIKLQQAQFLSAIGREPRAARPANPETGEPAVSGRIGYHPSVKMQMWLGKQWLGQSEKVEVPVDADGNVRQSIRLGGREYFF
jgi:hypothetical protein